MHLSRAKREVLAFLDAELARRGENTTNSGKPVFSYLELWPMRPRVGIRVAEIGFTWGDGGPGSGGATYMQSDPGGLPVCAAAERLIIDIMEEVGDEEIENSKWMLCEVMWPANSGPLDQ